MDSRRIDEAISDLQATKAEWANLSMSRRIEYLRAIHANTARVARPWVEIACEHKGLSMDHHLAGEEWTSGPFAVLSVISDLLETLERLNSGVPILEGYRSRELESGQVVVDVFPHKMEDRLLFSGVSAEVWMRQEVTIGTLEDHAGASYREQADGDVGLVLAAGNIASIAVLDVVYALFNERKVVVVKMNPVNDYTGPFFEEAFAELIADGYVRFVYGGIRAGQYLTSHPGVDSIHITGSSRTFDAIVFGTGEEGAANKVNDTPINQKPIGAELGGVGPTIVVPGNWSRRDIRFQAEHIVSQKMHNSGFNCVAAQVLVLPESWEQRDALLDEIRSVLAEIDTRPPYYPDAERRCAAALQSTDEVEIYGDGHKRYLLPNIPEDDTGNHAFSTEIFGPVLAVTTLPSPSVGDYLENAVRFANKSLSGTLGANIIIDPKTQRRFSLEMENAIAGLEYGTIAVNLWTGAAYFLSQCAWGAFPGHTRQDIGSGVGVVHNTLMFDSTEKSVVRGPFAPHVRAFAKGEYHVSPKLVYFVTNTQAHRIGEQLIEYQANASKLKLAQIGFSAMRG